jgi:hypothetical protein
MSNTMERYQDGPVEGSVTVVESGECLVNGKHIQLQLDALEIQTGLLHEACFTEVNELSHDLAIVLGAVKCADRSITRQHARNWARRLALSIPVYELETWRDPKVVASLIDTLQYLTGDVWQVKFVKRRKKMKVVGQSFLFEPTKEQRALVPYSHGLDSFAQTELLRSTDATLDIIPVHLRASRTDGNLKPKRRVPKGEVMTVPVSASIFEPKHAELSFRSRPFLFDGLAAYAAVLLKGGQVLVPENGQGSLGGSLVRLGAEAPHRSCHPGFTTRLRKFFMNLTGVEVGFFHPALYRTKGQVLKDLKAIVQNSDVWLKDHPSCSYDARNANRGGKLVHCGVCGNCLLRRVSLHAAGIDDKTPYKFANVNATTLQESLESGDSVKSMAALEDVARNSIRSMQRLSEISLASVDYRVSAEIEGLARYQACAVSEVRDALRGMLEQHRHEWTSFLQHCGNTSWVTQRARG